MTLTIFKIWSTGNYQDKGQAATGERICQGTILLGNYALSDYTGNSKMDCLDQTKPK